MVPNTSLLTGHLRQAIHYHLDNGLDKNALFIAGRLHAVDPRNPEAVHLLALCHFRLREFKSVYDYSRLLALRGAHIGCSYVFAQACLVLERYTDGLAALERARTLWESRSVGKCTDSARRFHPDAAAVYCLLGKLSHGNGDMKRAVECYCAALKLNPFMWDAFERLCSTGTNIRPSNIFKSNSEVSALLGVTHVQTNTSEDERNPSFIQPPSQPPTSFPAFATPANDPFNSTKAHVDPKPTQTSGNTLTNAGGPLPGSNQLAAQGNAADAETPTAVVALSQSKVNAPAGGTAPANVDPPNAPLRKTRTLQAAPNDLTAEAPRVRSVPDKVKGSESSAQSDHPDIQRGNIAINHHKRTFSGTIPQPQAKVDGGGAPPPRRSGRLLRPPSGRLNVPLPDPNSKDGRELKKAKVPGTRPKIPATTSTVGRVVSGNRKPLEGTQSTARDPRAPGSSADASSMSHRSAQQDSCKDNETLQFLIELFSKIGHGYHALSRYQGQAALQYFYSLPPQQRDTPWVLAQIGKAQYELNNYAEADKTFSRIKKIAPARLEDMEVYSTILYHLKNDTELAFLSHELADADRLAPQTWCAIGNSFSLQRDHDQALKCFKRATQLSPKFAYGYTLQGHEHMENEEYDKAQAAYRRAISSDHRHYNGWYGLGKVYEKLGKYEMAERHYRFAASINPTNAILVCCIGVVLERLKKPQAALIQYDHACELAPQSAISRFKKARALLHLGRARDALEEFKVLKDMVPDESNVHFMLGRVYKILHDKPSAIRHFTIALNLDPKAAQYIKEAMEALDDEDTMDDDDDEHVT